MAKDRWTDVIAGISVFLSMSYVAFANPVLMAAAGKGGYGMSAVAVFFATCLIAALATFMSGYYAGSPAALAPGLALTAVLSGFLTAQETTISWESALLVCALAGFLLWILSLSGVRRLMIDSIPPVIKKAIMAGIGSVLAKTAVDFVLLYPGPAGKKFATIVFAFGLLIIVVGYFGLRGLAMKSANHKKLLDIAGRASFIVSIVTLSILIWFWDRSVLANLSSGSWFAWLDSKIPFVDVLYGVGRWESIPLFILVLYVLIIDIIGSPYHLASSNRASYDETLFAADEERRIKRSFFVDSLANIVGPPLGSTPVVYYAENFTAKVLGGHHPTVAYVIAAGFVLLFLTGLGLWLNGLQITYFVHQLAVAPVLFVVGLIIMSESLKPDAKPAEAGQSQPAAAAAATVGRSEAEIDLIDLVPRIPAPLAIVLTPLAGFEIGIAAGIIFYVVFHWLMPPETAAAGQRRIDGLLMAAAVISVAIRAKLYFGS